MSFPPPIIGDKENPVNLTHKKKEVRQKIERKQKRVSTKFIGPLSESTFK